MIDESYDQLNVRLFDKIKDKTSIVNHILSMPVSHQLTLHQLTELQFMREHQYLSIPFLEIISALEGG